MKKVITIVSLSLIGLLILATVIMACIPVGVNPEFGKPDYITVYSSKYESGIGYKDYEREGTYSKQFKKIIEELEKAPEQKALVALFNGTISQDLKVTKLEYTQSISTTNTETNVAKFKITYGEERKVNYQDEKVKFVAMFFELKADQGRTKATVKLLNSENKASYAIEYYGDFDAVVDYINTLIAA